jgi:hypothetical protein
MKFVGLVAVAVTLLLATAATASAAATRTCSGVQTGVTYRGDVLVPRGGTCTLVNSTVRGDVKVLRGAYFQATRTIVREDVRSTEAQTVFVDTGSKVYGAVKAKRTIQVFVFNSTVTDDIEIERARQVAQVCGSAVRRGDLSVEHSGRDILVGDPEAEGCAGNTIRRGDLEVEDNFVDVELVVRGNTIRKGDLKVLKNKGPVPKFVEDNEGGDLLRCSRNSAPFFSSDNTRWDDERGQCD